MLPCKYEAPGFELQHRGENLKKIFFKAQEPIVCIPTALLADRFKNVWFQVLTHKEENPGQEFLKGTRLQMVLEDQPKTK